MGRVFLTLAILLMISGPSHAQQVGVVTTLPLYHDDPSNLELFLTPPGARRNSLRAAMDAKKVTELANQLGSALMGACAGGNPLACAMAASVLNEGKLAAGASGAANGLQQGLTTHTQQNVQIAASTLQSINQNLSTVLGSGYVLNADGTVSSPPPNSVTLNFADLASDQALINAGFTQAQIDGVKQLLNDMLKNGNNNGNKAVANNSSNNLQNSLSDVGSQNNMPTSNQNSPTIASVSSTPTVSTASSQLTGDQNLDGLSINFNGVPIGVAGSNMFNSVSSIYQNLELE